VSNAIKPDQLGLAALSHTFVGAGATIKPNTTIAQHNMIGAGAVVVKDTKKNVLYVANPAKFLKENK